MTWIEGVSMTRRGKQGSQLVVMCASLTVLALAACQGGDTQSAEPPGGEVTLQFWTWSLKEGDPNTQEIIDVYEEENPEVQIQLAEVGGTDDTSARLLAADRAGDTPDIVQVEYYAIPSLVASGALRDITDDVVDHQDNVAEQIWDLSTLDGQVYGVPQDIGPMMMTYRADIFKEYGIDVPTTWEDYIEAAEEVREKDSDVYLASFAADEFAFFASHAAQAGANWWDTDGESWSVGINDAESLAVADFWQDMVERDLLSVEPVLTPEWNAKVNDGRILSWTAAAWAPSVLYSVAPETAGQWESVPIPQWTEGDPSVPFLGGSAYLIPEKSRHAEEAAKFAAWLGASDEGSELLLTLDLYPGGNAGREAALDNPPPRLMPQQTDFYETANEIIEDTTVPLLWGPNVNVAQNALSDNLNAAALNGQSFADVFIRTKDEVVRDLERTGYDVE